MALFTVEQSLHLCLLHLPGWRLGQMGQQHFTPLVSSLILRDLREKKKIERPLLAVVKQLLG